MRFLFLCLTLGGSWFAFQALVAAEPPRSSTELRPPRGIGGETSLVRPSERSALPNTWQRIRRQGSFTASFLPDNLPYSADGKLVGFEVELVHALAARLGLQVKIDWINVRHETSLGKLLDFECDLVMGLPVDARLHADDQSTTKRILYTRPYCRTGYLLFVRTTGPRISQLKELRGEATRRVGTQAGTVADFLLKQRGYRRKLYGTQTAVLEALASSRIDYAYLWANATWLARTSPKLGVEIVQPYDLEDWRYMAAAVRRADTEFKSHLNTALAELVGEEFVEELLGRYGVPYYPPVEPAPKEAFSELPQKPPHTSLEQ